MLNRLTDVFASLRSHQVKYLVIGGIAVVLYGVPGATFDLDILIEPSHDNARRLLDAFESRARDRFDDLPRRSSCQRDHDLPR